MKEDNRSKLRSAPGNEKHLFVYIDPHAFLPWIVLIDQEPPPDPPSLPPEVDVVWAATEAIGARQQYVAWRAEKNTPFRSLGVVP